MLQPAWCFVVSSVRCPVCYWSTDTFQANVKLCHLYLPNFLVYDTVVSDAANGVTNCNCTSPICVVYCFLDCDVMLLPRHSPRFCRNVLIETSENTNKSCRTNVQWQSKAGQNSELTRSVTIFAATRSHDLTVGDSNNVDLLRRNSLPPSSEASVLAYQTTQRHIAACLHVFVGKMMVLPCLTDVFRKSLTYVLPAPPTKVELFSFPPVPKYGGPG